MTDDMRALMEGADVLEPASSEVAVEEYPAFDGILLEAPPEGSEIEEQEPVVLDSIRGELVPLTSDGTAFADSAPRGEQEGERIRIQLPIRVIGFDEARGRFIEDTHTIVVSNTGSLIALKHKVFPADTIRIINLQNMEEADFRIVGPSIVSETEVSQWGVENTEGQEGRNIWGVQVENPRRGKDDGALLKCKACGKEVFWNYTLLEIEVLEATGMIAMPCADCRKATYWIYAEKHRQPKAFAIADAVAPPPRVVPIRERAERRKTKRVMLKLPVLVRRQNGQTEQAHTEDMSKLGLAVSLANELEAGEIVSVFVPYHPDGTNIPQRAQMMWKDPYPSSGRRWHGFKFVR